MYLIVLFWFALAAYQPSLPKPCLLVWRGPVQPNYPRARPFFGNIFLPFTVVSNKVFMSNNKSGRKLKFHCWQETEHYFSQETLQGLRYSTVSEILEVLCRGVYSNLGVGAREKF